MTAVAIRAAAEMLGQRVTQAGKRIGLKNFSSKCGRVFFVNAAIGAGVDKTFRDAQRCVKIGGESSEGSYVRLPAKIRAHRFGNVPEFAEIDAAIGRALERHALWSGIPINRTAEASQSVDDTNTGDGIRVMTRCANPRCQRGPMGRPAIFRKSRLNQEFCSGACRSMVSKDKARAK